MGTGLGKPASLRRGAFFAGLTVATLLALALCFTDRSERLIELPRNATDAPVFVRDGRVYYQPIRRGRAFKLAYLPVRGGQHQTVVDDPLFTTRAERIQISASGILYTFGEPGDPSLDGGPGSSPVSLGAVGPVLPSVPPQRVRGLLRWPQLSRKRARFVPMSGGAPAELIADEYASALQIREQFCFWIRSRRTGGPLLTRPPGPPQGELMVASIAGGPYRKLGRVPDDVLVQPCGAGICWRQVSSSHSALLTCGPPDFAIEAFPSFPPGSTPIWLGDRLYWLAGDATAPLPGRRLHALMSARRDGSDVRQLWNADTAMDSTASLGGLFDDGRDLFYTVDRESGGKLTRALVRYRTTSGSKPENLLLMAGAASAFRPISADRGYLYLLTWEERENWLDWSRTGLMRNRVGILRRVHIPE